MDSKYEFASFFKKMSTTTTTCRNKYLSADEWSIIVQYLAPNDLLRLTLVNRMIGNIFVPSFWEHLGKNFQVSNFEASFKPLFPCDVEIPTIAITSKLNFFSMLHNGRFDRKHSWNQIKFEKSNVAHNVSETDLVLVALRRKVQMAHRQLLDVEYKFSAPESGSYHGVGCMELQCLGKCKPQILSDISNFNNPCTDYFAYYCNNGHVETGMFSNGFVGGTGKLSHDWKSQVQFSDAVIGMRIEVEKPGKGTRHVEY